MAPSRTVARMIYTRGGITVITGKVSGKRYAFTWETREQPIDPRDAEQFRDLRLNVSSCGCTGGNDLRDQFISLFEVDERPS